MLYILHVQYSYSVYDILIYLSSDIERPHVFRMPCPLFYEMPNFAILFFVKYSQNSKIRKIYTCSPQKKRPMVLEEQNFMRDYEKGNLNNKTLRGIINKYDIIKSIEDV